MDEADRKSLADMGFDADDFGQERLLWKLDRLLELFAGQSDLGPDPWRQPPPFDADSLRAPFPVTIIGAPALDPLMFTAELSRRAVASEVTALTAWIDQLGRFESRDDDDHVSYWSSAAETAALGPGRFAVSWWLDAAAASPRLVGRLVEQMIAGLMDIGLPVIQLTVGEGDG